MAISAAGTSCADCVRWSHAWGRRGRLKEAELALLGTVRAVIVTLDEQTVERARKIGSGNLSAGIRAAVAAYPRGSRKKRPGS